MAEIEMAEVTPAEKQLLRGGHGDEIGGIPQQS